jgi:hypothetical protein
LVQAAKPSNHQLQRWKHSPPPRKWDSITIRRLAANRAIDQNHHHAPQQQGQHIAWHRRSNQSNKNCKYATINRKPMSKFQTESHSGETAKTA